MDLELTTRSPSSPARARASASRSCGRWRPRASGGRRRPDRRLARGIEGVTPVAVDLVDAPTVRAPGRARRSSGTAGVDVLVNNVGGVPLALEGFLQHHR